MASQVRAKVRAVYNGNELSAVQFGLKFEIERPSSLSHKCDFRPKLQDRSQRQAGRANAMPKFCTGSSLIKVIFSVQCSTMQ